MHQVPFNAPYRVSDAIESMSESLENFEFEGGRFSQKCVEYLKRITGCKNVLLTSSCTAALEISALLANIGPGDEVIMPSFTFVSTANAFVLRGAKPVFVDVSQNTLNIDEALIESHITSKTKAIVAVHYAGVSCNMEAIQFIAKKYNLKVIEDAAQCIGAKHLGKHLGKHLSGIRGLCTSPSFSRTSKAK